MSNALPLDSGQPTGGEEPALAANSVNKWPRALQYAYWVFVAAAVVMAVSGLVGLFASHDPANSEFAQFLRSNRRFLSIANLVAAVIIAVVAPQLARAMKHARTILAVVVALSCFFNIAAVAIGVGGMLLVLIVFLLVVGTVLMYRPGANEYIREQTRFRF